MMIRAIAPGGIEDRRQVVERLRRLDEEEWLELIDYTADADSAALCRDIAEAVCLDIAEDSGSAVICRLCDLIEPTTCENEATGGSFRCSNCNDEYRVDERFMFCPTCGAEVVR